MRHGARGHNRADCWSAITAHCHTPPSYIHRCLPRHLSASTALTQHSPAGCSSNSLTSRPLVSIRRLTMSLAEPTHPSATRDVEAGIPEPESYSNAPVPPRSAWYLFCVDGREAYRAGSHSTRSIADTVSALFQQWTDAADNVRGRYLHLAEQDSWRYQSEVATHRGSRARRRQQRLAPERPRSAFNFFSAHHRDTIKQNKPSLSVGDVGRLIAADYQALTPEEREAYERLAGKSKKRFEAHMQEYQASLTADREQAKVGSEETGAEREAGGMKSEDE